LTIGKEITQELRIRAKGLTGEKGGASASKENARMFPRRGGTKKKTLGFPSVKGKITARQEVLFGGKTSGERGLGFV